MSSLYVSDAASALTKEAEAGQPALSEAFRVSRPVVGAQDLPQEPFLVMSMLYVLRWGGRGLSKHLQLGA